MALNTLYEGRIPFNRFLNSLKVKKHLFAAALTAATFLGAAAADKDPVLMTVDGRDVHVSEFEYLYNKNNSQQLQQQPLDEYLKMFIDYKLKVADAEHAGLQNTPAFIGEFDNYRAELAAPYLRSQAVEDSLVNEAYSHRLTDVYVSHIMLPNTPDGAKAADSLRTAILAGKLSFEDAAAANSIDRGSSSRGGKMGYVVPDRFPWPFEKASYDTAVGQLSPVVNSGMGFHIIRVESRTPSAGEVDASHILLLTRGKSPEETAAQKQRIDSLYNELAAGADFAELAKKYSEDPGSAKKGGELGFFGRGMMVPEFEEAAFGLEDGKVSKPFASSFGYHIVKRNGHRGASPLDDAMRKQLLGAMQRDERAQAPQQVRVAELMAQYSATLNRPVLDEVHKVILAAGTVDSTVIAALNAIAKPVASYKGGSVSVADVAAKFAAVSVPDADAANVRFDMLADEALRNAVLAAVREDLAKTNADYRNLVNEYRDGILLYEIANRNVWDRASKDHEGLEAFFKANAGKYRWEQPKFKSYVFFASSDSLLDKAVEYADSLSTDDPTAFTQDMRKRFGRDIKIERVIAAKGENAITDYLGFGAEKPAADGKSKWTSYRAYKGRVLEQPEEAADVRGAAVTDYQAKLEADWLKELHKRYKVKVNKKVFKKLKSEQK